MAKLKIKKLGKGAVQLKRTGSKYPIKLDSVNIGIPFFSVRLKNAIDPTDLIADINETASLEDLTTALTQINTEIAYQKNQRTKQETILKESQKRKTEILQELYTVGLKSGRKRLLQKEKKLLSGKIMKAAEEKIELRGLIMALKSNRNELNKRIKIITKRRGKALAKAQGDE